MIGAWYTLRALAREWDLLLRDARIVDAFSADRDELTLLLRGVRGSEAIRISVRPGDRFLFRQPDAARPRRNVTTLFPGVANRTITAVSVADRDRMVHLALDDGSSICAVLFGPRANVLHVDGDGMTRAAFRERSARVGEPAPHPKAAPDPSDADALAARWPAESMDLVRAVRRAFPLMDDLLAAELVSRASLSVHDACLVDRSGIERLAETAGILRDALQRPEPAIYRRDAEPVAFSLLPLAAPPAPDVEVFEHVDDALRVVVRARLSYAAYRKEYDPLVRTLEVAAMRNRTRRDRMASELAEASRADGYERYGHLLMTVAHGTARSREQETTVAVPDVFADGADIAIPVDPALSIIENAHRYYEKARLTRRAREEASMRLETVSTTLEHAERLLAELDAVKDRSGLRTFADRNAAALERFARERPADTESVPFRRFDLGHGYEVWVGRNAKENDELTFVHARKHDLWLHARGVPGSHVVLRNPRRGQRPPKSVIEAAASIAARFSKASGSALVPVIVTERRYVRKPRKALPGAVLAEREEVLLVEPRTPDQE